MERGNPADAKLYAPTLDRVIENYNKTPRDSVGDGGFASKTNIAHAIEKGVINGVY